MSCCSQGRVYPYPSELLHWHFGNDTIVQAAGKYPWKIWIIVSPGPLFKRTDVFPQDITKFWSREIRVYTFPIALIFNRHFCSTAAVMPVKCQSDTIITTPNRARLGVLPLIEWRPWIDIWTTTYQTYVLSMSYRIYCMLFSFIYFCPNIFDWFCYKQCL